jgi:hypothetical protein
MEELRQSLSRRSKRTGLVAAVGLFAALGGCNTITETAMPPHFDQQTVDSLNSIDSGADALFGQLQGSQPGCLFSNHASDFDKIASDLAALGQHVGAVPHNTRTTTGVADLGANLDHFRKAGQEGAASCLPAKLVQDEKTAFDTLVKNLLAYENKKPKGA